MVRFPGNIPILIGAKVKEGCNCLETFKDKRADVVVHRCNAELSILAYGLRGSCILGCKNCIYKVDVNEEPWKSYIEIVNEEVKFKEKKFLARRVYEGEIVAKKMELYTGKRPTRKEVKKKLKDFKKRMNVDFGEWEQYRGRFVYVKYSMSHKERNVKLRGQVEGFGVYPDVDAYWLRLQIVKDGRACGAVYIDLDDIVKIGFSRKAKLVDESNRKKRRRVKKKRKKK